MPSQKAISVQLGAKQQFLLQKQLDSGRYETADEVIDDALTLLADRDSALEAWLRDEVTAIISDSAVPAPIEDVFQRLEARHAHRVSKRGS